MAAKGYFDWEPIIESDAAIDAALEYANVPVLVACLTQLTGSLELIRGGMRIDKNRTRDLQCGLSPDDQTMVKQLTAEALRDYRDRGCPSLPPLDKTALRELLQFLTGQTLEDDYLEFYLEESEFEGEDAYGLPGFEAIPDEVKQSFHVVIVGAGMSGLLAGCRLKQAGVPFTIVERSLAVGGTWLDNQYPGCRVDSPSHVFEYSFARYPWPQYYCTQPVLQRYFSECATDFGIVPHIRFGHEVERAEFDEGSGLWRVIIRDAYGVSTELSANAFISAVGQLNQPKLPDIAGRDDFAGPAFHSARWDQSVDLSGKRVAVIGTGASAMQLIPEVAEQARDVRIFMRTPPWIYPSPSYRHDVPDGEHWLIDHVPHYARWYHFLLFWLDGEGLYASVTKDPGWPHQERSVSPENQALREFLIDSIKQEVGEDSALVEKLTPEHAPCGKRLLVDDGTWYRSLLRDDVQLITEDIERITSTGLVTDDGAEHEVDALVFATGFHASRFLWPMEIKGPGGRDLRDSWGDDPRAYLGVVVPGFPNLFCLYGPNTNIVVTGSTIFFSECGVHYIMSCLRLLMERGLRSLECRRDVHDAYNEVIDQGNLDVAWGAENVRSWYKNKAGRVTQNWPFRLLEYWNRTKAVNTADFELR